MHRRQLVILTVIVFILTAFIGILIKDYRIPSSEISPSVIPVLASPSPVSVSTPEATETTTILVFFNNMEKGGDDCAKVFPLKREVSKTPAIARAAIEKLLQGATAEERNLGYGTNIPQGVKIQSLTIEDGTAKIDFNDAIDAGGSCRVTAIRAQITQTLQQFPTVENVIISVNGNVEEALQP